VVVAHRAAELPLPAPTHVAVCGAGGAVDRREIGAGDALDEAWLDALVRGGGEAARYEGLDVAGGIEDLYRRRGAAGGDDADAGAETVVELEDVAVRHPDTAAPTVEGITLRARRGEYWCVLGGNGAGKSSVSRLVGTPAWAAAGELSGRVAVGGAGRAEDPAAFAAAVAKGVSVVSTEAHLALLAAGDGGGGAPARDVVCPGDPDAAAAACALAGLPAAKADAPFSTLSLGEQRVALVAKALASGPRLVAVFDEPSHALDAPARAHVRALIDGVAAAGRCAVLHVTHHPDEIGENVTHALLLEGGKVAFAGPVDGKAGAAALLGG
jgi:iron complex transport system ATP-binding protein